MALFPKFKDKDKRSHKSGAAEFVESLIVALIMALIIKTSIVEAYKIPSGSMEDTLLVGDFLLANKFVYGMTLPIPFVDIKLPALDNPKPGDIIIFKYPENLKVNYIKRCIAIGGQTIEIRNKNVYVDGKLVPLPPSGKYTDRRIIPYQKNAYGGERDNLPLTVVPEGYLFMMGDNRDNSADSRFWGFLDRRLVMGRALMIHWSWAPDPKSPDIVASDPLSYPKWTFYNIGHLPSRVRWNRLANIIY